MASQRVSKLPGESLMRIPFILFVIALSSRLAAVAIWPFDGLYGQDAFAYYRQAIAIAENLPRGQLPPLDFFWPNGYPLVVALFMLVLGQTAVAAQWVSLLSGAALAPLAYALSGELFPEADRRAGILAGLIVAVAGQPILSSIVVMADMPALCWATLAAWLLARAWRRSRPAGRLLGAGAALALAIVTRWIYVLLVPAFSAYAAYQMRRHKSRWRLMLVPVLSSTLILLPQVWLSLNRPEGLLHSWLLGWNPANAFQRQFDTVDGHLEYALPVAVFYVQPAGHPAYLVPLLGLAAVWGIWRAWRGKAWGPIILLLGWSGAVYLFLAGIPYENFRFGLTLYLPLALFAGFGLSDLWRRSAARKVAQTIVVLSLAGMLAWAYAMLDEFLTVQNQGKAIARQVNQVLPQDATLLSFGLTLTLQHYTPLRVLEFFYLDEAALDDLTRSEPRLYLLLDVSNVESQWSDREPEMNYRWLQAHTTLTHVNAYPPYVLLQVRR